MAFKATLVTLGVRDFQASLAFYRDGMGLQSSSASQDDIVFFPMGGIVLALYPREKLAEDAQVSAEGRGFPGFTISFNARSEKEVDETMKRAVAAGAKPIKPAQKVFWGGYSGYFADPDGHLWEVAHNPFWELDEQGNVILS